MHLQNTQKYILKKKNWYLLSFDVIHSKVKRTVSDTLQFH